MESGLLQAGRSVAGRAGGELLVAAAGRRAEERVREAGRPGPEDVLDPRTTRRRCRSGPCGD